MSAAIGPASRAVIDSYKSGPSAALLALFARACREAARAKLNDGEAFAIEEELYALVLSRMDRPCDCYGCAHGQDRDEAKP